MAHTFSEKTNMIKWIGIVTMTIDHIGYFLFPGMLWLRIIGRIAFPCFLYTIIEGTQRTHNYPRYLFRLLLLGVLSMPVTPNTWNVLFLLALFSFSLKYRRFFLICLLLSFFVEYSVYGFLFGWALWWMKERNDAQGIGLSAAAQLLVLPSIQIFSLLSLPLFLVEGGIRLPRMPKYFFYAFYPLHQLILICLAM
ncbi:TraX family protein [Atopococcus tabaci]|uniref:TraX family protein n=1 Tax=Atopococcus tabaci TaxID=269774 RepID=UPI00240A4B72|nr:TraX family protein [Atopococcus tabaci]